MNSDQRLILVGYFLLLFHDICFVGRFAFGDWGLDVVTSYLGFIQKNYWIFFILELLAVLTFFADLVIGYDKKEKKMRLISTIFTAILLFLFLAKLLPWYFGKLFIPLGAYGSMA